MKKYISAYWNRGKFAVSYFLALEQCNTFPIILNIETTNNCPMTCRMCPRTYGMSRKKGFMSMGLFENICRQISEFKYMMTTPPDHIIWLHHFGEPLLDKMLIERIKLGNTFGISFGISINPQFLTSDITNQLLSHRLHMIYFSLDGTDQQTLEYNRGKKANYNQAVANIEYLLEQKTKNNLRFPLIQVGMIDMEETNPQVNTFLKFWKRKGVDEIIIKPFESFDGSSEEVRKIGNQKNKSMGQRCVAPWREVSILWDGRVVACCADFDASYVLGDLNNNSLLTIWNDQAAQMLRREHSSKIIKNRLCRDCINKKEFGNLGRHFVSFIERIN